MYVSDDAGETWSDRRITGFDAPHTDDIHHIALEDADTMLAATGSGLYRTTDTGRTWHRLDAGRPQTYFREAAVHDGRRFAGGSPASPRYWTENRDHALLECGDGETLDAVSTPVPDEVAVGWTELKGGLVTATNLGTLLRRNPDGLTADDDNRTENHDMWTELGTVPVAESVHGRCIPMTWLARP